MKKIVFLLIGEIKYDGRVQKEINTLINNGYEVELIVNKFYNDDFNNYNFKIHPISSENIRPVPNTIGKFKFCIDTFKLMKKIKPDIVHCNDLCTLYGGYLYKKFNKNSKLVYDAHELYPEMFSKKVVSFFWSKFENIFIKKADKIISPEENRAKYMKKKYRLIKEINIIENLPSLKNIEDIDKEINVLEKVVPESKEKIKILYLGAIIPDRNIEEMIGTIKFLNNDYCLFIIGKCLNKEYYKQLQEVIKYNNLDEKVYILDPVPNKDVIKYINSSDVGLVFYNNNNLNNYYCASNKTYEFIVCNKPIITNNYPGLITLIKDKNLGICLESIDSEHISKAILNLSKVDKVKEINAYFWENQTSKFLSIYK